MTALMDRRLAKLEASSRWGGPDEIARADIIMVRIPPGGEHDPRVTAARLACEARGQGFYSTSHAAAGELPLWRPVSIDRVSDALLDAAIAELRERIGASSRLSGVSQ